MLPQIDGSRREKFSGVEATIVPFLLATEVFETITHLPRDAERRPRPTAEWRPGRLGLGAAGRGSSLAARRRSGFPTLQAAPMRYYTP